MDYTDENEDNEDAADLGQRNNVVGMNWQQNYDQETDEQLDDDAQDDGDENYYEEDENAPGATKKRSKAWAHFTVILNAAGTKFAKCKHCVNGYVLLQMCLDEFFNSYFVNVQEV